MIILHIHQFKHRLTKLGALESAPIDSEDWGERGNKELNLTGADKDLIRNTISRLRDCIPDNYEFPVTQKKEDVFVDMAKEIV
jgi:hypothetical protein